MRKGREIHEFNFLPHFLDTYFVWEFLVFDTKLVLTIYILQYEHFSHEVGQLIDVNWF